MLPSWLRRRVPVFLMAIVVLRQYFEVDVENDGVTLSCVYNDINVFILLINMEKVLIIRELEK